ncbi:MAG: hypothetical protein JNK58_13045, partial [Phycisphaerae bacterium]|nr:hypothetical protein [Phycisphaerae bacterium]
AGELNNITVDADAMDIQASFADLVVTSITVNTDPLLWGRPCSVSWTVENQGTAPATFAWTDYLRVSTDTTVNSGDPFLSNPTRPAGAANLAPGASYTQTVELARFNENMSGSVYFFVTTDYGAVIAEGPTGEGNNVTFDDVAIPIASPDVFIDPASIVVDASVNAGTVITVQWTVTNQGPGYADWQNLFVTPVWRILLSTDTVGGNGDDVQLDNFGLAIPGGNILDPGESQVMTRSVTLPQGTTGTRYIVVRCDVNNTLPEGTAGEANNISIDPDALEILAAFPDLVVTSITVNTNPLIWGQAYSVSWTVENQGTAPATGSWTDYLRVSTDAAVSSGDPFLSNPTRPAGAANLAPGASYTQTVNLTRFTENMSGSVYFFVVTDYGATLGEGPTGESNNTTFDDVATPISSPDVYIDPATIVVPSSADAGTVITVQWSVTNQGLGYADWQNLFVTPVWRILLSTDTVGGNGDDVQIDNFGLAIPGGNILDPGETQVMSRSVTLPQTTTGTRYIVVRCDVNNTLPEGTAGEANNISIDPDALEIQNSFPDLVVTSITVNTNPLIWGQAYSVSWTVENQGTAPATLSWTDYLRVSTDATASSGDPFISNPTRPAGAANLAPGASYTQTVNLTRFTENMAGSVYFFVVTDYGATLGEGPTGESNNITFDDVATPISSPDVYIDPALIVVPALAEPNSSISVQWTVTNQGAGYADWQNLFVTPVWRILLSTDTIGGNGDDVQLDNFGLAIPGGNILDPGESQVMTRNVTLPVGVTGGRYIVVRCDVNNSLPEGVAGEANNISIDPDVLTIQSLPNLRVPEEGISVPSNVSIGQSVQVSWTIQNSGNGPATGTWIDEFFLSTDRIVGNDIALGSASFTGTIGAGQSDVRSRTITIPPEATGTFYFLVRTDITNTIVETNEGDNFGFDIDTFTGNRPDLAPTMVSLPTSAVLGQTITIQWNDSNSGLGDAVGSWFDRVVLSVDANFGNADDVALFDQAVGGPIPAGGFIARSVNAVIPASTAAGNYTIFVRVDSTDVIPETNEANNLASAAQPLAVSGPDLVPTLDSVSVPSAALAGTSIGVSWTELNAGGAPATGNWTTRIVLSTNTTFGDADDIAATSANHTGPLAPAATALRTNNVFIPAGTNGTFNVIVRADFTGTVTETNEANNTLILGQVAVGTPDLLIADDGRVVPPTAVTGQPIVVQWKTMNNGSATAPLPWNERVVLSPNAVYGDGDDVLPLVIAADSALAPGAMSLRTATLNVQQVFFSNFEGALPSQVSGAGSLVGTQGYSAYGFGSQFLYHNGGGDPQAATVLTLTGLPPHSALSLSCLIAVIDSWDGPSPPFGPDLFSISVDGVTVYTTNFIDDLQGVTPVSPREHLGFSGSWQDIAYELATVPALQYMPHTASTATIRFFAHGTGWQGGSDESWAIDNLRISVVQNVVGDQPPAAKQDDRLADAIEPQQIAEIILPSGVAGAYNVIVRVDSSSQVAELNENNNTAIIGSINVESADLVSLSAGAVFPSTASPGQSINIQWSERNDGTQPATGTWLDRAVLSLNTTYGDADDIGPATVSVPGPLAVGATATRSINMTVPLSAGGVYNLIVRSDHNDSVPETNESNNTAVLGTVTVAAPDLLAENGSATPSSVAVGQSVFVQWSDRNAGLGAVAGNWTDRVVLSIDAVFGNGDDVGGVNVNAVGPLAAGDAASRSANIVVPAVTPGTYNVLVRVDNNAQVAESNEANNVATLTTIQVGAPDLSITGPFAPSTGTTGTMVNVGWTGTNIGSATAFAPPGGWTDRVYISTDAGLGGDTIAASVARTQNLDVGAMYTPSASITLPSIPGDYYIIVALDVNNQVNEPGAETNNTGVFGPITVVPPPNPDLDVTSILVPASATAGDTIVVQYTVTNIGNQPALVNWQDAIFLSTNSVYDGGDTLLRLSPANQAPLAPTQSYTVSRNVTLPVSFTTANAFIIIRADHGADLNEQSESNNTRASSAIAVTATPAPDLIASGATGPSSATYGEMISVSWTTTNQGTANAAAPWSDAVFLSPDASLSTTDRLLGSRANPANSLASGGGSYNASLDLVLPLDQQTLAGPYYILIKADGFNGITENNENNNVTAIGPVMFSLPALPNIQVTDIVAPSSGQIGLNFAVNFRLSNVGALPAIGGWLSEVRVLAQAPGAMPRVVAGVPFSGTINPGES